MKKKVLIYMGCIAMLAGMLMGCGTDAETSNPNAEKEEVQEIVSTQTPEATEVPDPTEAPDSTKAPIEENSIVYTMEGDTLVFRGHGVLTSDDMEDVFDEYGADEETFSKVIIHNGITGIGDDVFRDWSSLTYVELPSGLEFIGDSAFYDCNVLNDISIPDSVTGIGDWAFGKNKLYAIVLPKGLKTIGNYAFRESVFLKSVELPEGLERLGMGAFSYCESIKNVKLPESLTTLEDITFLDCPKLTTVEFSNGLKKIGKAAFARCSDLAEFEILTLPDSVTEIDDWAFFDSVVNSVVLPDEIIYVGENAFEKYMWFDYTEGSNAERYVTENYDGFFNEVSGYTSWDLKEEKQSDDTVAENIVEYVGKTITGKDLVYFLATMNDIHREMDDHYTYTISCESVICVEGLEQGDVILTSTVKNGNMSTARVVKNSDGAYNMQIFILIGRNLVFTGMSEIHWDAEKEIYTANAELHDAYDDGELIYDPETGEPHRDIWTKGIIEWEYRNLFEEDDLFYIHEIISEKDGSFLGYSFEQTTLEFVE